jgi:outer membrane protein OmpA-like peptidoglycan-associated protein
MIEGVQRAHVILLAIAGTAAAEPVRLEVVADVGAGQKPAVKLVALDSVTDIKLELERDDGKQFTLRQASLAKGKTVTLAVGDGSAGKVSYKGTLSAQVAGASERWSEDIHFDTRVRGGPLSVAYDEAHLDLDKHVLQFKPSRPVADATLVVIGEDGNELGKGAATYKDQPAGAWLAISWTQPADARVMVMKLRAVASDGAATNVELVPWSVTVAHEDVNFRTDSYVIDPDEAKKLDASLVKIRDVVKRAEKFMKVKLYIAGHTDTVGPSAKNRKLSLDRANAIGRYFRKQGLTIPIVVAGFGEDVLKVPTPDDTDERANRRADYVIGPAGGTPPFRGPYLKAKAEWRTLR